MKNKIVLFITIIVCFLLQCTIMDYISIGSITPNLPLILCVAMGLMRGRKVGLWTGFFSGLFIDLFYGSTVWFLCADLYVCRIYQRLRIPQLL